MTRTENGFALLIVLWTMVLLGVLGSTITAAGRSEASLAGNLLASAKVEAAADGGIALAVFHLLDPTPAHWSPDGTPHTVAIGNAQVQLVVQDQDGLVDPNQSPPSLIAALLRQAGADDQAAKAGADAIVDWRSVADAGLAPLYAAEHRAYGPPHEPFESVDELGLVATITPAMMAALRPHIDVFLQATPNPAFADTTVTAAIVDATKRDQLTLEPVSDDGPTIIAVTASAHAAGSTFTRRALLRFDATAERPYEVLEWTQ